MKRWRKYALALLLFVFAIYLNNAPWLAGPSEIKTQILAHRGAHIQFDRTGLTNQTCTAAQSLYPVEFPLENTLESIMAAFDLGADIVEIDIHLTTDGRFAVFHDWTVDCRTEGTGATRDHDLVYLQSLDIAYGYTSDGGKTYPLRGQGTGLMPSLREVMDAFPKQKFLIDFKSNDALEGAAFIEFLSANPARRNSIWGVYGGHEPVTVVKSAFPDIPAATRPMLETCLKTYFAIGWSGHVPASCDNGLIMIPSNYGPYLWGWPIKFADRMADAGSTVILRGPLVAGLGTGIDTEEQATQMAYDFPGVVWTDNIRLIAPLLSD